MLPVKAVAGLELYYLRSLLWLYYVTEVETMQRTHGKKSPFGLTLKKIVCRQSIRNGKFSTEELFIYFGLPEAEFPELRFTLNIFVIFDSFLGGNVTKTCIHQKNHVF